MAIFGGSILVLLGAMAAPAAEAPVAEPSALRLESVLDRLGGVARLYRDTALDFTCDERIACRRRGKPTITGELKNKYIYSFDEQGMLADKRVPRTQRQVVLDRFDRVKRQIPELLLRPYSWMFIFEPGRRERYRFQLSGSTRRLGRRALRVEFEPIPPVESGVNDWHGWIEVDAQTFQPLHVEAVQHGEHELRRRLLRGLDLDRVADAQLDTGPFEFSVFQTQFRMIKNGMRFPSKVVISRDEFVIVDGIDRRTKRATPVYSIVQTYKRYNFFRVRTADEIREIAR